MSFDPREWRMLSYLELGDLPRVRALVAEQQSAIDRSYGYEVFKSR
ncbi:MAG: hypothetical protein ACI9DC_003697 [Gammaproteobacteria bacterium]|jgi:hypothetical protein